jgi:hypothetical protein
MATAKAQGKFVLLLAGRPTCSNCQTMKNFVAESETPPVKALINDYFVPWYSDIDESRDHTNYISGLSSSWVLPLICVIDPDQPSQYLDRSTGVQQAPVFYQRLLRQASALMVRPRITEIAPTLGSIGTRVTIIGNNLTNVTQVLFNGVAASFTESPPDTVQAEVPPGASSGPITVITVCGETTSPGDFVVVQSGVVVAYRALLDVTNQTFFAVFQLTASNQGPALAMDIHLTNRLAIGADLDANNWPTTNLATSLPYSAEATLGTHNHENGVHYWHLESLAAGAQAMLAIQIYQAPPGRLNALATYAMPAGIPALTNQNLLAFVDIPAVPSLEIQRSGTTNSLSIRWNGTDSRWKLQSTGDFPFSGPILWNEIQEDLENDGKSEFLAPDTTGLSHHFYRLVFDPSKVPETNTICPCFFCEP